MLLLMLILVHCIVEMCMVAKSLDKHNNSTNGRVKTNLVEFILRWP